MANTRKRRQKQTLKEFKAWLQGVEELQADNWSPNREQWQLIRAKIDGIVEEKQIVEKVVQTTQHVQPMVSSNVPVQGVPPMIPPPPPTGGIPVAEIEMTPAAKALLNPAVNGGKVKTPDVDTSDGNITSPFA